MKGLKLINWKLALFALGALVCAAPIILSSCGSKKNNDNDKDNTNTPDDNTLETSYGQFIPYTNEDDYAEWICSSNTYSIDGNNITFEHEINGSRGAIVFKFNDQYIDINSFDGENVDFINMSGNEYSDFVDDLSSRDTIEIEQTIYMPWISYSYLTEDQVRQIYSAPYLGPDDVADDDFHQALDEYYANLPTEFADCQLHNNQYLPIDLAAYDYNHGDLIDDYNFYAENNEDYRIGYSMPYYLTLIEVTIKGSISGDDIAYALHIGFDLNNFDVTYLPIEVVEFTFTIGPNANN